jgi:hypothetical protein
MTGAIVVAVLLALAGGAITGFGKRWEESLLLSALVIPLIGAAVAWALSSLALALMTFFWSFLAASIAWGVAACARHAVNKLCELTARRIRTRA